MNGAAQNPPPPGGDPPWQARNRGPRGARLRRFGLAVVLLALAGLFLWGLAPRPVEVETATATDGPLTVHVTEEGRTRIRNRYVVSAPVSGEMSRILLKAGDKVEAGRTLLTAIRPVRPAMLDARAELQAKALAEQTEAARKLTQEQLEAARTAARFADAHWRRMQGLGSAGGVSATDRDAAERDAQVRARELRAAEFACQVAEYEAIRARSALADAGTPARVDHVDVHAPVTGSVLRVMQESSAVVAAGTPLLEIGDTEDLEVEAEILSRDAAAIPPGAPVSIEQWGGPEPLQGRVRRVEPAAFTKISALGVEEQRVLVLADILNPPQPGYFLGDRYRVEVRVAVWHTERTLQIPSGSLFREGAVWHVFRLSEGRAQKTAVEIGRSDGKMTQILGGIPGGTVVLLHPPDTVADGTAVRPRAGGS